jgi:hypothetical protein
MSKLLLISRDLHDELEEILYTQFIFSFDSLSMECVRHFLRPLSTRAKGLVREVLVKVLIDLGLNEDEEVLARNSGISNGEALEYMRNKFDGIEEGSHLR